MRDILTVIAGAVLLLLAAALVAPPFVDWPARREAIERALARTTGTEVRTEGRLEVRLLPWPRMRFEVLRLGPPRPDAAALAANHVKADIALTALLGGEVRFTEARIGRAEITLPAGLGGEVRLPRALVAGFAGRALAVEDLRVAQLLVTFTAPATGRTDQFHAEGVRIEGGSLAGPWRAEGTAGGVPFRLAAGSPSGDGEGTAIKLTGGGEAGPRFDVEGRIALEAAAAPSLGPLVSIAGTARVAAGPAAPGSATGLPVPLSLQASFRSKGAVIELDPVSVESGEGASGLQLTGTGELRVEEPRLKLALAGKRFDADAYLASPVGEALREAGPNRRWPEAGLPLDLDLALESLGAAGGDWSGLALTASLGGGTALVRRLETVGPGGTKLSLEGQFGADGTASGRLALASTNPEGLRTYLRQAGMSEPWTLAALSAPALDASGDFTLAPPVISLRDLRLRLGEARVTGAGRYTLAEPGARGRLEAQVAAEGLDLARLPMAKAVSALQSLDLGLVLDGRDLRWGSAPRTGRLSARLQSDGRALVLDPLEVADLAGAQARIAGRIEPDGSGRIEGNVRAAAAGPLLDLLESAGASGARSLPGFVRRRSLDLRVAARRDGRRDGGEPGLSLTLDGKAGGGDLAAEVLARDGRPERLTARLATVDTSAWFERPDASALRRGSRLSVEGARDAAGTFPLRVTGEIAGAAVATARPLVLAGGGERIESGALTIRSPDLSPLLVLLSDAAAAAGPIPADLALDIGRAGDGARVNLTGRVAGSGIRSEWSVPPVGAAEGTLALDRLSLPWLAAALVLNPKPDGFGPEPRFWWAARAALKVGRLELGRGFLGENASLTLSLDPEGLALRDLSASFAGGRLAGDLGIARREGGVSFAGEGSVADVVLESVAGARFPVKGRLTARLRFGGSGAGLAGVIGNLAGSGQVQASDLRVEGADPAGLDRAVKRALAEADPLARGRIDALVAEELTRGPLVAESLSGPVTMVAGALRIGPLKAETGAGSWDGTASLDLKSGTVDARGLFTVRSLPKGWTGTPPAIQLGWRGPLARPAREIDATPLATGLAAVVLQRELERIEDFEADANERARRAGRLEMERARKAAEAARQARLREEQRAAEEAARQGRLREEAARAAEEAARQARLREEQRAERARAQPETGPGPPRLPPPDLPPPLDIRPAPQMRSQPGGLQQP